jgi:ubiquinone/menaquinone biosynthesis C-methylase UbiE
VKNNYNRIAPFYDRLVHFAFGDCQKKAQIAQLNQIDEKAKVLVVGGGSGLFLPELFRLKPAVKIDYLEPAPRMNRLAKNRLSRQELAEFQLLEESLEKADLKQGDYDVILTFFFFDLFPINKSKQLHAKLFKSLKKDGIWLIADFKPPQNKKQRLLIKSMFLFLHFTVKAQQKSIYSYEKLFSKQHFKLEQHKSHCNNLFFSSAYRKSSFS